MSERPRSLFNDPPIPPRKPKQISLRAIFYTIAAIAVMLAVYRLWPGYAPAFGLFVVGVVFVFIRYRTPRHAANGVFVVHSINAIIWMWYASSIADGFHDRFVTYFPALLVDFPLLLILLRVTGGSFGFVFVTTFVVGGAMWWLIGWLAAVSIEQLNRWWNAHERYP